MAKDVILTGLRANSEFHLGNYLGAILPMVKLQQKYAGEYQINMFVPDLHSFTTPIDHGKLFEQTHQNLKVFLAAGLDINQPDTYIYRQSYIPAHSEMTWILDCFTGFGEASRMTEFKDKAAKLRGSQMVEEVWKEEVVPGSSDRISVGLFNYPVLMAADILLYGAKWVPVGDDQRQHVEFARDIAQRLNKKFGELFVLPADNAEQLKFSGRENPVRVRSLRNPYKKMSKSVEDPAGTIMLSDKPEDAAMKVLKSTTDDLESINYDYEKQPGISNLLEIRALLLGQPIEETARSWKGNPEYHQLKNIVAAQVSEFLSDLQTKLKTVDDEKLMQKLEADEKAMNEIANKTLLKVQKAVGLRPAN
ncbi:tryptophan--tRNA ligase [Candidatus Saccharibacteria bacterium]|nr:tryptophan--tRNA ligase [Candidatus Saccharibacteria bacterium]